MNDKINRQQIEDAGNEYVYKNISKKSINANYENSDILKAFVDGFEFHQWCNEVSMTGPQVPLHIKYRMYYNQKS